METRETRTVVRKIVVAGVLSAVAFLLGYTGWGFIPLPTPVGDATIMHVPVIIGGILEGPVVGLVLGLIFGLFSMYQAALRGVPAFLDPLVAILPRLFIGITAWAAYAAFKRVGKYPAMALAGCLVVICGISAYRVVAVNPILAAVLAIAALAWIAGFVYVALRENRELQALIFSGAVGTLTNTILVLSMLVIRGYLTLEFALGVGVTQGIPEIIVACIIVVAVVGAWKGVETRRAGSTV